MKIEDYEPDVHISRPEMDAMCKRVVTDIGMYNLWNATLNKHIVRYGCFDKHGKYFGNLGLEIESAYNTVTRMSVDEPTREYRTIKVKCGDYAHFNLRGVKPEIFNIHRNWLPGEFATYMKCHPAIYKRVAIIKAKCCLINIHIHDDINIDWGP